MRYTDFLVVKPKQSTQLFMVLLCSHLISVGVIFLLVQNHWFVQLVVLLLIGFSWFYYYRLYFTKVLDSSVLAAYHHQDKGWLISIVPKYNHVQDGDVVVILSGSSYVSQWWIILNFYPVDTVAVAQRRYTLLVPADSVSAEVHRQLRVRLKIM